MQDPKLRKSLTIVANKSTDQSIVKDKISPIIDVLAIHQRYKNVWQVICHQTTQLSTEMRQVCYDNSWDFALQAENPCKKKLFFSDMDATIVVGETIDYMANFLGIHDKISAITEATMQGELDYHLAIKQRLELLKGIPRSVLTELAENIPITKGAYRLLNEINKRSMDSYLISGGFSIFAEIISRKLGFKHHLSNVLSYSADDKLDGYWVGDLVTAEVKEETLKNFVKKNNLDLCQTVVIGDGANDIKMIRQAGLGVAFYGKSAVRNVAQAEIHSGKIDNLLWFL